MKMRHDLLAWLLQNDFQEHQERTIKNEQTKTQLLGLKQKKQSE